MHISSILKPYRKNASLPSPLLSRVRSEKSRQGLKASLMLNPSTHYALCCLSAFELVSQMRCAVEAIDSYSDQFADRRALPLRTRAVLQSAPVQFRKPCMPHLAPQEHPDAFIMRDGDGGSVPSSPVSYSAVRQLFVEQQGYSHTFIVYKFHNTQCWQFPMKLPVRISGVSALL